MPPKFTSVKRKKRKGFNVSKAVRDGNQPGDCENGSEPTRVEGNAENVSQCESSTSSHKASTSKRTPGRENKSASKLINSSFSELEGETILTRNASSKLGLFTPATESASGYKLLDFSLLQEKLAVAAICSNCRDKNSKLAIYQNNDKRHGLAEDLLIKCNLCEYETPLSTSRKLGGQGGGPFEVNRRSVIATVSTGGGLSSLQNFCTQMNLTAPVTKNAFQDHLEQISKASKEQCEQLMADAAERLRQSILAEDPELINADPDGALPCKITVDGTWQKRGHSSKIGVVFIISVKTGEILDYEVKSLHCHECAAHENWDHDSEEYSSWKQGHECMINHQGSSNSMESSATVDMFLRSIEKRGLKYTTYVGDGDSDSFGKVKAAVEAKYGDRYVVVKEDCVGHIQKRMGTALRKLKKDRKGQKLCDGKSIGGKGRLTDAVIDEIQGYYGKAIRQNKGDLDGMRNAVWAIYHHKIQSSKLSLKEQHKFCPEGPESWCKYQKDVSKGTKTYKEEHRLPEVFREELLAIFTRLSKDELLSRCLGGLTQNQNESVNGQLWARCPKSQFCGKRRVEIAVCETVGVFNTGAASKAILMQKVGVVPGNNMLKGLRAQDSKRIMSAAQKVSKEYISERRKKRHAGKSKSDASYLSGGFDLGVVPDIAGSETSAHKGKGKGKGKGKRKEEVVREEELVQNDEDVQGPAGQVPIMFVEPLFERLYCKKRRK